MSDTIHIDPTTQKEFSAIVEASFNEFVGAMDDVDWDEMTPQDIAEHFFFNGFLRGCLAMTENEDIHETLYMIRKEIDYQMNE